MRHRRQNKYGQSQRRNPGHSSNQRNYHDCDRKSRSTSRTSNFNRASHEKEVRRPELDSDIDGVPMDILPNIEPWKEDVKTNPEMSFEPISDSEYGFPNHCWVGEYLDEGVEKDITPLSHDAVAKEILERQYWNAESSNLSDVSTDHLIYHNDSDKMSHKLHPKELQMRSKPTLKAADHTLDYSDERKIGTHVGPSFFSNLNNYDDLYNSLIRPQEDISAFEEQRLLLQEQTLVPNRLAEVYDYGHGGNNSKAAKNTLPIHAMETVFEDEHYDTFSGELDNPNDPYVRTESHSIKTDDYRKKYLKQSLMPGYSSYDDNENSFESHKTSYEQATDLDGSPVVEYPELSDYDKKIQYLASSPENTKSFSAVTAANIGVPAIDDTKSTKGGFPISVLSTSYRQRQYLEKKNDAETRNSPSRETTFLLPGSNNTPLKVKPILKKNTKDKIQSDQDQGGIENMSPADTRSFSNHFFKGNFNDTRKVLLNENKESSHRVEDDHETLSHDRIVVNFQHNDAKDIVRKKLHSNSSNVADASKDFHHTEEKSYDNKSETNFHSSSVFPFFQDAEDVNRKSDDSEGSHHSRSFQRRSMKHSTTSHQFKSYSPSYISAKYSKIDNPGIRKTSGTKKPTELKRKLNRRNFNQLGPHKAKSTEKQSSKNFDKQKRINFKRKNDDDVTRERRSTSRQLSDTEDFCEKKRVDIRKFETKYNLEMNIDDYPPVLGNESSRSQYVFHTLENSKAKRIGYTLDQKETNDETSIKISLLNDGSRCFNESSPGRDLNHTIQSVEKYDSSRIVRNADIYTSRSDNDDLNVCDMNISPSSSPNIRGPDTNRLAVNKIDELNEEQNIASTDKRFIRTTKLYEEKHVPIPWLQEYKIWFNDLIRPILSHDKYAREAGLIDSITFLKSVTKGNRRSLSYIPRGDPAKQILKFIALNKSNDEKANREISNQSTGNRKVLTDTSRDMSSYLDDKKRNLYKTNKVVNTYHDVNSRIPFNTNRVRDSSHGVNSGNSYSLSDSSRHVWNRSDSRSSQSSISATNELTYESKTPDLQSFSPQPLILDLSPSFVPLESKKESNKSFYIDKLPSVDKTPNLAIKNFVPDKSADGTLRDAGTHRHKKSHRQAETYDTVKSGIKPVKTNIRKKYESRSSTQTYASNGKGNSWEDAISSSELRITPRIFQTKLSERNSLHGNIDKIEAGNSSKQELIGVKSFEKIKTNNPKPSTQSRLNCEKQHTKPSRDEENVNIHSSLQPEKDKKSTSQNASINEHWRRKYSITSHVPDAKKIAKSNDGILEKKLSKDDRGREKVFASNIFDVKKVTKGDDCVSRKNSSKERHHSSSGNGISKNIDNNPTTVLTKSNHNEGGVSKSTICSSQSSDKKLPDKNKDSKRGTGGQHELQRKAIKNNESSKFASIDRAKVSSRAVDFKGEEYTCIKIPDSKPTLTAEQERLLPLFKKQVEKCVIRNGVNVLYKFEKYRIGRIFEVGTNILEQFGKLHRTSEFTAHHAIYYIWCLFEDPTKNVLDELTRKLRKVNLDRPCFLEDMDTFMLFQRTVFNMCYDQLNPKVRYSAQTSNNIRSVRFRSENFFPQFYGESQIIMKLWSWYERMCSIYGIIGATKKDARWKVFPEYNKSSKSLEEKIAIWLKEVLKGRLYQISEALSINIVREVDRQLVKKDGHATKEMVVMLVVKVWLQNYFKEESMSIQHHQEHHHQKNSDGSDSRDLLENLVILDEVYSDESGLDEDKVEMDVDVSDEISSLASVQVIDLF